MILPHVAMRAPLSKRMSPGYNIHQELASGCTSIIGPTELFCLCDLAHAEMTALILPFKLKLLYPFACVSMVHSRATGTEKLARNLAILAGGLQESSDTVLVVPSLVKGVRIFRVPGSLGYV